MWLLGCLCVGPVIDWHSVQSVPSFSKSDCWVDSRLLVTLNRPKWFEKYIHKQIK